jgi:predicted GNAT family acetyltransferase
MYCPLLSADVRTIPFCSFFDSRFKEATQYAGSVTHAILEL